jgi:PAS domain S-box-containing protein
MNPGPDPAAPPGGDLLHSVLEHMREGVLHGRMLYDDAMPSDFVFLYVNRGFQQQTGLGPVVGRRASEVIPGIRESDAGVFEILGRVASGGVPETFEKFIDGLGQWYSAQVYSPRPDHFVAIFNVVTGRKLADLRHAGLRAEQQAILDSGIVGLVKVRQRRFAWANSAFLGLFGYTLPELVGQSTQIVYPTRLAWEAFGRAAKTALEAGMVYRVEHLQRHKDGTLLWCAISTTTLAPGSDELIGAFIDITERKRFEAALALSEARLKEAQRIARIGSWSRDLRTETIAWSDEMFAIYGVPLRRPGPTPADCLAAVHPQDHEPTRRAFQQSVDDEKRLDFIHRVLGADGEIRHVHVRGETSYADDGTPLSAAGTAQDVTEATRLQAALRADEARLRGIFSALSEGLVFQGQDGRIVDANPAAEAILGLTRDQLLGRTSMAPSWRAVHEDGSPFPGHEHPAMVTLRTGRPLRGQVMGVYAPSFGLRWLSVNSSPIFLDAAATAPDGVVASFVNITGRHLPGLIDEALVLPGPRPAS